MTYTVSVNDSGVLFSTEDRDEALTQFRAAASLARHPHGFATGREVLLKADSDVIARWSPDNPGEND